MWELEQDGGSLGFRVRTVRMSIVHEIAQWPWKRGNTGTSSVAALVMLSYNYRIG